MIDGEGVYVPCVNLGTLLLLRLSRALDAFAIECTSYEQVSLVEGVATLIPLELKTIVSIYRADGEIVPVETFVLFLVAIVVAVLRALESRIFTPTLGRS